MFMLSDNELGMLACSLDVKFAVIFFYFGIFGKVVLSLAFEKEKRKKKFSALMGTQTCNH